MKTISYFQNDQGDYTITMNDEPVAITKSEEFASQLIQMQFLLKDFQQAHDCTKKLNEYMQGHKDCRLGRNVFDEALAMVRERDAIVNILKIRR